MWDWLKEFRWWAASFALAFLGGIVRGMSCPRDHFTWRGMLQRVGAAVFVGVIVTLILAHAEIPETMKTAVAGAAGFSANDILESLKPWVKKRLGL